MGYLFLISSSLHGTRHKKSSTIIILISTNCCMGKRPPFLIRKFYSTLVLHHKSSSTITKLQSRKPSPPLIPLPWFHLLVIRLNYRSGYWTIGERFNVW